MFCILLLLVMGAGAPGIGLAADGGRRSWTKAATIAAICAARASCRDHGSCVKRAIKPRGVAQPKLVAEAGQDDNAGLPEICLLVHFAAPSEDGLCRRCVDLRSTVDLVSTSIFLFVFTLCCIDATMAFKPKLDKALILCHRLPDGKHHPPDTGRDLHP